MEYPNIWAWGKVLHSTTTYIQQQRSEAIRDNAKQDVIYKDTYGTWHTVDDILSGSTKQRVKEYSEAAEKMPEPTIM